MDTPPHLIKQVHIVIIISIHVGDPLLDVSNSLVA